MKVHGLCKENFSAKWYVRGVPSVCRNLSRYMFHRRLPSPWNTTVALTQWQVLSCTILYISTPNRITYLHRAVSNELCCSGKYKCQLLNILFWIFPTHKPTGLGRLMRTRQLQRFLFGYRYVFKHVLLHFLNKFYNPERNTWQMLGSTILPHVE